MLNNKNLKANACLQNHYQSFMKRMIKKRMALEYNLQIIQRKEFNNQQSLLENNLKKSIYLKRRQNN